MNVLPPSGSFIFVVDTTSYAGAFERPLVAFMTGQVGECEVGADDAAAAKTELVEPALRWFEKRTLHLQNVDHGNCLRPATIWATPGWFNDGLGNFHPDVADSGRVLNRYRQSGGVDQPGRYPAYLSVAVAFDEQPPGDVLEVLKQRARTYCSTNGVPLTGFRLLELEVRFRDVQSLTDQCLNYAIAVHEHERGLAVNAKERALEIYGRIAPRLTSDPERQRAVEALRAKLDLPAGSMKTIVVEADGAEHTFSGVDALERAQVFVSTWHQRAWELVNSCGSSYRGGYEIVGPSMVPASNADRIRISLSVKFKG